MIQVAENTGELGSADGCFAKRFLYPLACALFLLLWFAGSARAIDLYVGAQPQSTSKTCQSYASVLALAAVNDPRFEIKSFAQLRENERRFRAILTSLDPGGETKHNNWPKAMEQLTNGSYNFEVKYIADIVEWMAGTRDATTLSSNVDAAVAALTGNSFNTVLTSISKIDNSDYANGHIVTVLSVAGTGIDSETQLVLFNSALKGDLLP